MSFGGLVPSPPYAQLSDLKRRVDKIFDVASTPDGLAGPFDWGWQCVGAHAVPYSVSMASEKRGNLFVTQ